jgi:hypothetical protein
MGGSSTSSSKEAVPPFLTLACLLPSLLPFPPSPLWNASLSQHAGDLPQQQWSDVFKESGPGELGTGGSEPAVDILLYAPVDAPSSSGCGDSSAATATAAAVGTVGTVAAGRVSLKCTASCGPHKLLLAESCPGSSSELGGLLLGLTDDVDCAVMTAAFSNPAAAAAAAGGSSSGGSSSSSSGDLVVTHSAFLPAIAYVVAGKTQRRHLLLGEQGQVQMSVFLSVADTSPIAFQLQHKAAQLDLFVWRALCVLRAHSLCGARLLLPTPCPALCCPVLSSDLSCPVLSLSHTTAPAGDSQSPVCCALVEGRKYSYLYGRVPAGSSYGQQQVRGM